MRTADLPQMDPAEMLLSRNIRYIDKNSPSHDRKHIPLHGTSVGERKDVTNPVIHILLLFPLSSKQLQYFFCAFVSGPPVPRSLTGDRYWVFNQSPLFLSRWRRSYTFSVSVVVFTIRDVLTISDVTVVGVRKTEPRSKLHASALLFTRSLFLYSSVTLWKWILK